jgi:hypothetical protein
MAVPRLAVSIDQELARAVRKAAGKESTSSWLAEAARRRLRSEGLLRAVREWEAQHGEISDAELRAADRKQRSRRRR